jgi:hypothetical protein
MSLTLVVLAAGIGSRYGGLKQIEAVGPGGEIVIEYSVFDALRAGFDRVVCVIRRDIETDFRAIVAARFERQVRVDYVFQDLNDLPAGVAVPPERRKPWGTAHAVRACREAVREPFAVINADDFYGRRSFAALAGFLTGVTMSDPRYSMVAFTLGNTLSEHGHVARGICEVGADGTLRRVVERTHIERAADGIVFTEGGGTRHRLTGHERVSMNMWGLTPALFPALEREFSAFVGRSGSDPKAECYLPAVVDTLVREGAATVRVLDTPEAWFGVTYPQDKGVVVQGIRGLVDARVYPEKLWG